MDEQPNYTPQTPQPLQPEPPIEPQPLETRGSRFTGGLLSLLGAVFNWIIVPLAIVFVLHTYVFQAFHVVGSSMVPTLHEADYLIITKVDASIQRFQHPGNADGYLPKRQQIIVFHYPKEPNLVFVKRVIGLPGERIVVKNGKVKVYNASSPSGFDPDIGFSTSDPVTLGEVDEVVPPGNVFVMGDNRTPGGSFDSREWGMLPTHYIIGQASLRLLPLDHLRILSELEAQFPRATLRV